MGRLDGEQDRLGALLADLVERGLELFDDGLLVVIDGAKALGGARCSAPRPSSKMYVAQGTPPIDLLDKDKEWADAKLVKAFSHPDPGQGLCNAKHLAGQLDKRYPSVRGVAARGAGGCSPLPAGIDGRLAKAHHQ